ncbi:hypothetical protein BACCIP111895_03109 [Neobacillus rhizosphaerae]|uniref:Group-specific protein n=1 Tax=Neobacillus rhizosphaerae TaxID=2880965 RepID=A0ABM9ETE1_9BACI|nr:hypothetical protein [Neobacillus rhizosphaerae]CAH2715925.1 hypothetical protein BACCIP111895_03109 [Neobacillus rhizosphaerae]
MIKKILISICICIFKLITTSAMAQTNQQIQIIDISKGKVIKNVQKNSDIQQEVEKFLEGITGVYVKLNPYPNNGFVIKIPLEPNVMVKNQWFNDFVDEVMIIFPGQEHPYLMVFDNENQPYFLTFQGDTSKFLGLLNFKP